MNIEMTVMLAGSQNQDHSSGEGPTVFGNLAQWINHRFLGFYIYLMQ